MHLMDPMIFNVSTAQVQERHAAAKQWHTVADAIRRTRRGRGRPPLGLQTVRSFLLTL